MVIGIGTGISYSVLAGGVSAPSNVFAAVIPSGTIAEDITAFPTLVDLSTAPNLFWDGVSRTDGGDIRVTDGAGVAIPFHLVEIDTTAKTGLIVAALNIAASADTSVKIVANNDAEMLPIAADAAGGQHEAWAAHDAVYLLRGDLTDATGNGRTLTWSSGSPTFTTGSPAGGGIDTTATAGYGFVTDAALDNLDFEMFAVGRKTVENSNNQVMMGVVTSPGSNFSRRLMGERDSTNQWTYFSTDDDWNDSGVSVVLNETTAMSFSGRAGVADQIDGFFYVNGVETNTVNIGQLSEGTIMVGSGRGSSNSDFRGQIDIAIASLTSPRSASWHKALYLNWAVAGGLFA